MAQASLKMARKLRDENPTPKSIEDIRENLVEEIADVDICAATIINETNLVGAAELVEMEKMKKKRWKERLEQHSGIDYDELFK